MVARSTRATMLFRRTRSQLRRASLTMKRQWTEIGILLAVLAVGLTPAIAQVGGTDSPIEEGFLGRLLALSRFPSLPALTLTLVAEIDLPGPLPGTGPRLVGERIEIAVAGGVASMPWTVGGSAAGR